MSKFDERIKNDLAKRTDKDVTDLKDEIWNEINQELFERRRTKMKRKKRWIPAVIIAAAALVLAFTLQTDPGLALIKGIKDMFAPEKEIIQSIEGQDEPTKVQLNEGKDSEYIIYVDQTRYKMVKGAEADIITTIEPLPEKYPEVSMEIKQYPQDKPEELVKQIEAELKMDFPKLRAIETVSEPVEGYWLHGLTESKWDGKVVDVYVISNGKDGSYVITERYFLEAAEGHGARFRHMLESFEIVE
ncbi:hypothetical protein [Sporosarcina highlanderae]|uniref:DUF4367 domain-containing protein n=1 Tax=Sporosarcina highlanderae TaxID=3035916 RepID=A0ABT8JMK9_9BACL|nr:hypothetical protein [Sporosarcina highlanderae]MDN4606282.1 hypothetical protein [Sporosarcina highlanderae]